MTTLRELASELETGHITARALVEQSLERIADPAGEGARAFISVNAEKARAEADIVDRKRSQSQSLPRFAGIPFGIKDLFDVAGEVTTAGSRLLSDAAPATVDCDAVDRMRKAGFILVGRTNMTEFAYSGVGLNPHHGTPLSVYRRDVGHIPGGSSSGSGVAVGEGMVPVALGTDTGGSCRIPAAFNGVVGYKSSWGRVSKRGVYPLSQSLDTIGPLANSATCCAIVDQVLAGGEPVMPAIESGALKIGVLRDYVLNGLDGNVANDFDAAVARLTAAGHRVSDVRFLELAEMQSLTANGGILAAEAFALHAPLLAKREAEYDPRVSSRLRLGGNVTAADLQRIRERRQELIALFVQRAAGFDAVICPTVPIGPPRLSELAEDAEYRRINGMCLRNTYVFNFVDGCAISLPMHREGAVPTGLMLALPNGGDARLFLAARVVEAVLASA